MKNWITRALTALTLALTVSHSAFAATEVKVGMSGRYFPFTFVKQDQLQGFEVDVWHEIGKRNDYDVEFVTASFSGLFGLLETGRIDTISNQITITPEREAKFLFSQPYVIDGAQLVVRKGNDSIQSTADLSGKTVGVNLGSNYEQILRQLDNAETITIKTYDSGIEHDVALGRTDAFVMDRLSSAALIKKANLPLQLVGDTFEPIENAWPFADNAKGKQLRDEVNTALQAMRKDGTLTELSMKWFGTDITQ
ncbi:amino acid ABC transporter periplasmic amino acid-binding portion [Photobacterium aphoticum]|uniref:Amino acid ABC transporter periplasmic amino acid-binding portion n=1 Tax=Photobacterium aphoticum TaxID=754436 RepID=A0A090R0J8_9GAMM|nr:amino acid ABC transporter periplasmic amino acid-binding portion [Photobacterium aphoticum]